MSLFIANCGANAKPADGGGGGFAGPSFVAASAIASTIDPTTVTLPSHQADDILICHAMNFSGSSMTNAGWSLIDSNTAAVGAFWWWKRAASGAESNPVVGSGTIAYAIVYVFRGCLASGTPYEDATLYTTSSDQTPETSAIDTAGPNRLAACFEGHYQNIAYSSGLPPTGWAAANSANTAANAGAGFACITKEVPSAANVPSVEVATLGSATFLKTVTLALIPA